MQIIREPTLENAEKTPDATIVADRLTLAKRRWRGIATDGHEFAFDLGAPLTHDAVFTSAEGRRYLVEQRPEPVLEIALIPRPAPVARLGWALGNLHFPIEVTDEVIRVPDDIALRQFFEREKIPYEAVERVFQPFARTHGHVR